MTTKKGVKKTGEGGDFLGLLAFGSAVTNIFQAVSQMALEKQNEALKIRASDLKNRYQDMIKHYKQLHSAYLAMRNAKEGLSQEISILNEIINEIRAENNRLVKEVGLLKDENLKFKSIREGSIPRKRRVPIKKTGEKVTNA